MGLIQAAMTLTEKTDLPGRREKNRKQIVSGEPIPKYISNYTTFKLSRNSYLKIKVVWIFDDIKLIIHYLEEMHLKYKDSVKLKVRISTSQKKVIPTSDNVCLKARSSPEGKRQRSTRECNNSAFVCT